MKITASIKLDKDVKQKAQKLAKELGLSLSTVVNEQLQEFIQERRIVFSRELEPTPYLERVLEEADKLKDDKKDIVASMESDEDIDRFFDEL